MKQFTFLVEVEATSERLAKGLITATIVSGLQLFGESHEPCIELKSVVNARRVKKDQRHS